MANVDVWPICVEDWFEASYRGEPVWAVVSFSRGASNQHAAQGWVEHFEDQATETKGLSGDLTMPGYGPHPMTPTPTKLEIKKVGSAKTTITVSMVGVAYGSQVLDDPVGGIWWNYSSVLHLPVREMTSYMFEVFPDTPDAINVQIWLNRWPGYLTRSPQSRGLSPSETGMRLAHDI